MFVCAMRAGSSEEEEEDVMDILQVESSCYLKSVFLYKFTRFPFVKLNQRIYFISYRLCDLSSQSIGR